MANYKIAIIEDDVAIAQMYRMKFEAEDFEVELAENGLEGIELLAEFDADIVLLDLMMPEVDGTEMLTRLRSTDRGKKFKVIILTNMGHEEAPAELKTLDVDSFIVKAEMTPRQVAEHVNKVLSQSA